MKVKTKWKDISFEEVQKIHTPYAFVSPGDNSSWNKRRGKELLIQTPSETPIGICGMPHYISADGKNWACGHIAEIGD